MKKKAVVKEMIYCGKC